MRSAADERRLPQKVRRQPNAAAGDRWPLPRPRAGEGDQGNNAVERIVDRPEQRPPRKRGRSQTIRSVIGRYRPAGHRAPASASSRSEPRQRARTGRLKPDTDRRAACMPSAGTYSIERVAILSSMIPAQQMCRRGSRTALPARPILGGQDHQHGSDLDRAHARGQEDMRRDEDLHVEAVGAVPRVVERRRCEHGKGAPRSQSQAPRARGNPRTHRASRAPPATRRTSFGTPASRSHPGQDAAEIDRHVRRGPERVAADRQVPMQMSHSTPRMTLVEAKRTAVDGPGTVVAAALLRTRLEWRGFEAQSRGVLALYDEP